MERFAVKRGATPAYRQIARILRNWIAEGRYATDGRLPTEDELMAEFSVSRHTVRAAVSKLVEDGYVERFAGRGTFVVNPGQDLSSWRIRSLEDIIAEGDPASTELLEATLVAARADPAAADALDVDADETVLRVMALRRAGGQPAACLEVFVPQDIGERVLPDLEGELARRPLVRAIEERLGLPAARAVQTATAGRPRQAVADALAMSADDPALVLQRTYYGSDGLPIEFVRLTARPDRYSQTVEFIRHRA